MAKPQTDELKYYSRDTKSQDNEQYIEAKHGPVGFYIMEKLRMHIYGGVSGYYCEFKEMHQYLFCKNNCNISIDDLKAVLETCFLPEVNLFNKELFEQYSILTSAGIQKRWVKIVTDARRKHVVINPAFCLIMIEENAINDVEIPAKTEVTDVIPTASLTHNAGGMQEELPSDAGITSTDILQSKVKESKEDESKEDERGATALPPPAQQDVGEKKLSEAVGGRAARRRKPYPTEPEAVEFFKTATEGVLHPAAALKDAKLFMSHYTANGWVQKSGQIIVDWKAAANGWILRDLGGEYQMKSGRLTKAPPPLNTATTQVEIEKEVEYLYQRYLEDQLRDNQLKPQHYDCLKKADLVNLNEDQTLELRSKSIMERIKSLEGSNEASFLRLMSAYQENKPADQEPIKSDTSKLYAILKPLAMKVIFQQAKDAGKQAILKR